MNNQKLANDLAIIILHAMWVKVPNGIKFFPVKVNDEKQPPYFIPYEAK